MMQSQATVLEAHLLHSLDVLAEESTQRLLTWVQTFRARTSLVWTKTILAILHASQTMWETMLVTLQVWVQISSAPSQRPHVLPLFWLPPHLHSLAAGPQ